MGNACGGVCGKKEDIIADAKAEAAKLLAKREAAAAEALEEKIKSSGANVDREVMKHQAALNKVMVPLSSIIIEYQRVLDGNNSASILEIPQLAVWAKSPAFCGDKEASTNIHLAAARIAMIAEARTEFLDKETGPSTQTIEMLTEAKQEIREALSAIETYAKAEIAIPGLKTALDAANEKFKSASDDKSKDAAEAVVDAAKDKHDDAVRDAASAKTDALKAAKGGNAGAELIKKACAARAKGFEKIDAAVIAAAKATEKTPKIRGYEPEDVASSLTALGQDMLAQAKAKANEVKAKAQAAVKATDAEISKLTSEKMSEAKRLLTLAFTSMDGWAKEEATQGIGTAHGPKDEKALLEELSKVLSAEGGAKAAVAGLVLKNVSIETQKCIKASVRLPHLEPSHRRSPALLRGGRCATLAAGNLCR